MANSTCILRAIFGQLSWSLSLIIISIVGKVSVFSSYLHLILRLGSRSLTLHFSSLGDILNSVFSISLIIISFLLPFFTRWLIRKNFEQLGEDDVIDNWGIFYREYRDNDLEFWASNFERNFDLENPIFEVLKRWAVDLLVSRFGTFRKF